MIGLYFVGFFLLVFQAVAIFFVFISFILHVAKGDEYHEFRGTARQHWDTMKSYYQKVLWL